MLLFGNAIKEDKEGAEKGETKAYYVMLEGEGGGGRIYTVSKWDFNPGTRRPRTSRSRRSRSRRRRRPRKRRTAPRSRHLHRRVCRLPRVRPHPLCQRRRLCPLFPHLFQHRRQFQCPRPRLCQSPHRHLPQCLFRSRRRSRHHLRESNSPEEIKRGHPNPPERTGMASFVD